ncbi:MAG: deoxynucleoside kinase [Mycoplasmoidaceae bacterium]|nr:deoxynucleoside kinase [Mycoplasmoidaceae bacterium]
MREPKDFEKQFKEKCVLHEFKPQKEANAIAVGGMISAGKSTIVEQIVKKYGFEPIYELSNDPNDLTNILLERMYKREQIAQSVCQIQFLLNRFTKYKEAILNNNNPATKVFDRTIFEDRLFAFHNMLSQPDVFEYYEKL